MLSHRHDSVTVLSSLFYVTHKSDLAQGTRLDITIISQTTILRIDLSLFNTHPNTISLHRTITHAFIIVVASCFVVCLASNYFSFIIIRNRDVCPTDTGDILLPYLRFDHVAARTKRSSTNVPLCSPTSPSIVKETITRIWPRAKSESR